MLKRVLLTGVAVSVCTAACGSDDSSDTMDPASAERAPVDRFSTNAGTLFKRDDNPDLPPGNVGIDFDTGPFVTRGLGPDGQMVQYYNFDVMPTTPAPIYVLFREGEDMPVDGQLNIVDAVPGDAGYNDLWLVNKVNVPANYKANTVTSFEDIVAKDFTIEPMDALVNCPIVPEGSTAVMRGGEESSALHQGWYRDEVVNYFTFEEAALAPSSGSVALSPIYVSFNVNPDQEGGGPPSGFKAETNGQTHNVVETTPADTGYSPLWMVNIYDNADFDSVSDLETAQAATILATGAATVNCPLVDF